MELEGQVPRAAVCTASATALLVSALASIRGVGSALLAGMVLVN
jgi:hypothetical protein